MNGRSRRRLLALLILLVCLLLATLLASPGLAHEGMHPVRCEDVEVPQPDDPLQHTDCHEPGEAPNTDHLHPLCMIVRDGQGSSVGELVGFVECLPETGAPVEVGMYGLMAAIALILGTAGLAIAYPNSWMHRRVGRRQ